MLTQERLKELFNYNPDTGLFTRLKKAGSNGYIGEVISQKDNKGYIRFKIDRKSYRAHRLAFLYMDGEFPKDQVDHKNRVRDDNKWKNLRHADYFVNAQNKVRQSGKNNSQSGIVGVYCERGRWRARGYCSGSKNGKQLGCFDYFLQACAARWEYEALECN